MLVAKSLSPRHRTRQTQTERREKVKREREPERLTVLPVQELSPILPLDTFLSVTLSRFQHNSYLVWF